MNITVGLIGLGAIVQSHVDAIAAVPALGIVGVCDPIDERRQQWSGQLKCPAYADHGELLAQQPDVVVVAIPHGMHADISVQSLQSGSHVVVEKPMAVSVEQCRRMLSEAKAHRRVLMVSELCSFEPGPIHTAEKFRAGQLGSFLTGSIINARCYFHAERPSWFLDPAMSGGGMFANIGLHRLAVARACLPGLRPTSVSASVSHISDYQVEACTSALVKYEHGGAMIYEEVGYYPRPTWMNLGTHLVFDEGIVSWDDTQWRFQPRRGEERAEPLPARSIRYRPVYENLVRAVAGDPYEPRAWEYAVDTAIAQATYASSAQARTIDLTDPDWRIDQD